MIAFVWLVPVIFTFLSIVMFTLFCPLNVPSIINVLSTNCPFIVRLSPFSAFKCVVADIVDRLNSKAMLMIIKLIFVIFFILFFINYSFILTGILFLLNCLLFYFLF